MTAFGNNADCCCLLVLGTGVTYDLETYVTYGGHSISCGYYKTRAEIEKACTAEPTCVGYSTYQPAAYFNGPMKEKAYYPWCLKTTQQSKATDVTHNYYRNVAQEEINHFVCTLCSINEEKGHKP